VNLYRQETKLTKDFQFSIIFCIFAQNKRHVCRTSVFTEEDHRITRAAVLASKARLKAE
jgi:hypothetical protein